MAEFALIFWVPVTLALFARLRPGTAATIGLLGGLLLLPSQFSVNVQGLPALDKERVSVLAVCLACLVLRPRSLRLPRVGLALGLCAALLVAGSFGTALTNGDPVDYGGVVELPPLRLWDGVSLATSVLLDLLLPFYLGWTFHRQPRDLRRLLRVIVVAGCLYSLPILYEARMSPQLHELVYGYRPFGWRGELRPGGFYRPVVFFHSGLAVALFVATCVLACIGLWRARIDFQLGSRKTLRVLTVPTSLVSLYLIGVLLTCRSLASILYATAGGAALAFLRSRLVVRCAVVLAALTLFYPTLRALDLFPTELCLEAASVASKDRAHSLDVRFVNEDLLLHRARERVAFGWGGWKRNRVFNERTGRDVSLTDGYWIIMLGIRGLPGFVGAFGLLLLPIFRAAWRFDRLRSRQDRALVAATTWLVAINGVDLIPNAMINAVVVFVSGALAGAMGRVTVASARRPVRSERRSERTLEERSAAASGEASLAHSLRIRRRP